MSSHQFIDWWTPYGKGEAEAAHRRYEKAIQFSSGLFSFSPAGVRPADKAFDNSSAGRGCSYNPPSQALPASPEPPPNFDPPSLPLVASPAPKTDRNIKLTITLMILVGLSGGIGVTLYFIVQMTPQLWR